MLIFIVSSSPNVQKRAPDKRLLQLSSSAHKPPPLCSSHLLLNSAILWICSECSPPQPGHPSSSISATDTESEKALIQLFRVLDFLQLKALLSAYLSLLQSGLCVHACGSEWLWKFGGKKVHQTAAKVGLELLLLTTLQRPGMSRTASNWLLFQRGGLGVGVTSVQMCLSSISCAHVCQCCPRITPQLFEEYSPDGENSCPLTKQQLRLQTH